MTGSSAGFVVGALVWTFLGASANAADTGHIQVKCEPGIQVFVDGDLKGKSSADVGGLIIEDVPAGQHTLRAVKEGFAPQEARVTVQAGKVFVYEVKEFVPKVKIEETGKTGEGVVAKKVGTLIIQSLPVECTVHIPSAGLDRYGKTQDEMKVSDVPTGKHAARFSAMGRTLDAQIDLEAGAVVKVFANFVAKDDKGITGNVSISAIGSRSRSPTSEVSLEGIALALIPAGTFMMGSPENEKDRGNDETQHEVTISKAFYMGVYEVTQEQYEAVMGKNDSCFKGAKNPVERVSWDDAVEFCKKLSAKTGKTVRLPTEAEWEYACRAGTKTPFHTGETISTDEANYDGNYVYGDGKKDEYRQKTLPVGTFRPNPSGLYDMHGNVWEWCSDWNGKYEEGAVSDPQGPANGTDRVLRGGSWTNSPRRCRSAFRNWHVPGTRLISAGFRVCLDVP